MRCEMKNTQPNCKTLCGVVDWSKWIFGVLSRENFNDKIGVTKLNEILPKSMLNIWSKQAHLRVFDCKSIDFKKAVNMFDHMEIAESIYEGVVEPSY